MSQKIFIPIPTKVTANKCNDFYTLSLMVVNYSENKVYED